MTFENSLHHVTEIGRALAEAMRVARRAVVIVDPWFDLSIPSQKVGDRFERWLKALDRMTGMVHWDPIAAGEIAAACNGSSVTVRHLLQLTPMSTEAFEYYAGRAQPHKGTARLQGEWHGPGAGRDPDGVPEHRHHRGRRAAGVDRQVAAAYSAGATRSRGATSATAAIMVASDSQTHAECCSPKMTMPQSTPNSVTRLAVWLLNTGPAVSIR